MNTLPNPSTIASAGLPPGPISMEVLNSECFCISLDTAALRQALESEIGQPGLFDLIQQRCPYLFATRPVFLSHEHMRRMAQVVQAVESVVALPAYREEVLAAAPTIARHDPGGAKGVFFGYDFHATEGAFGLIEINTNAGGAMLNAVLARAQRACCAALQGLEPSPDAASSFEESIMSMFRREWSLSGHERPLRSIAIVDENPAQQYLYPEFLLFQRLFQRHGVQAVIAGPSEFTLRGGVLWHGDLAIDIVYNRLTDFSLAEPASATLREAYLTNAMVLTPHPRAHALYADKRNLTLLSDATRLQALGVPQATQDVLLAGIPHTQIVDPQQAERLWRDRRRLFFKPFAGFGGRAAYRGDKLTQRVWQEILAGGYVAQALVAPGGRALSNQEPVQMHKFDLRTYTYDGSVQWVAARLYQGQTTNFRTPGGGFAPVYEGPADRHMMGCTPVQHESRLFLLDDDAVQALDHERYVALARGEAPAGEFADRRFILVDWYLRLACSQPEAVVNETCSWLVFDANGWLDPLAAHTINVPASPTEAQWAQIRALVFGDAVPHLS
ncbi:hypothetical protein [Polaromonas naphthalenivorans]|uniref:Uncharacterized protein n=1 Tax=Polaromonas naphthalenivorans (strain CJ2) TaxID=365044 RepID=A1VVT8_POLNA|nr:hypothetical protein Pnap_4493 [Polaromonas naphthalenivorans CJ2]